MCGVDALTSSSQMLNEVNRLLKVGGFYILITYGDPTVRMPCLKRSLHSWKILLDLIPRPGFKKQQGSSSTEKSGPELVPLTDEGLLPQDFALRIQTVTSFTCAKKPNGVTSNTILPEDTLKKHLSVSLNHQSFSRP